MTAPTTTAATTSAAVPTLALAEAARTVQLTVRAQLLRDVATLWPLLDPKRLDKTFPGWLRAMIALTSKYHSMSALAASAHYQTARQLQTGTPTPEGLVKLAPAPDEMWMTKAYGYSAPGLIRDPAAAPASPLSTTLGTAARIAHDGGRTTITDTIEQDPVAVGWFRVTDGSPCSFCALIASRGLVFKSEKTASFESHNNCGCTAAPAFSRDHAMPEVNTVAAQVYRDRNKILRDLGKNPKDYTALQAFRLAWSQHQGASAN